MSLYEFLSLCLGFGRLGIIWWGIRAMTRVSEARGHEHEMGHEETMTALKALIERRDWATGLAVN